MGYLKLKSVLPRYFPTLNINYSNLNYFTRDAAGALRAPMSAISGDVWNFMRKTLLRKKKIKQFNVEFMLFILRIIATLIGIYRQHYTRLATSNK